MSANGGVGRSCPETHHAIEAIPLTPDDSQPRVSHCYPRVLNKHEEHNKSSLRIAFPAMTSTLSFVTLDVFTTTRYIGNPVAVVWVPHSSTLTQTQKQQITREFNLSETVFLHQQTVEDESKSLARIDIFTPLTEVPFAGHPTVGTANYLLRLGDSSVSSHASLKSVKTLQTKAGPVPIVLSPNPAIPGVQISVAHNIWIHASPFASYSSAWGTYPVVSIVRGMTFILARLESRFA